MPFLSRQEFVDICNNAIVKTREKITIGNQLSGYAKYHREIKENQYVSTFRANPQYIKNKEDRLFLHDFIEYIGISHCSELANYLAIEIALEIQKKEAQALISIVRTRREDHVYLQIKITLANEPNFSLWEVEAWNPRIIDRSVGPDNKIKNKNKLAYGIHTILRAVIETQNITPNKDTNIYQEELSSITKPEAGETTTPGTPKEKMLEKHPILHKDYTIEAAIASGNLPAPGKLENLQQPSFWQKAPSKTVKVKDSKTHRYQPY